MHPSADMLNAYAERALDERERLQVGEHLCVCEECREVLFLAAGAEEVVLRERRVARRARWWRMWVPAVAMLALLLAGLGWWTRKLFVVQPLEVSRVEAPPVAGVVSRGGTEAVGSAPTQQQARAAAKERVVTEAELRAGTQASDLRDAAASPVAGRLVVRQERKRSEGQRVQREAPALSAQYEAEATPARPLGQAVEVSAGKASAGMVAFAPGAISVLTQWRVSESGQLQQSTDGKHWSAAKGSVVAGSSDERWAVVDGSSLIRSGDGGRSWIVVNGPEGTGKMTVVEVGTPGTVVIKTESGATWKTVDGGRIWTRVGG